MILVSKGIYLSRGNQCRNYKNHAKTQSYKHVPFFFPKRAKIVFTKARDLILEPNSISTRAREFNGASRIILKSCIA